MPPARFAQLFPGQRCLPRLKDGDAVKPHPDASLDGAGLKRRSPFHRQQVARGQRHEAGDEQH